MSQETPVRSYSGRKIFAYIHPDRTVEDHVNLAPNLDLAAGTILGRITDAANDVQTVTATGTVSGGTYTLTITDPLTMLTHTTAAVAYNANAAAVQTAVNNAIGSGKLTVGGGALPGTGMTLTGAGDWAGKPIPAATIGGASLTGGGSYGVTHTTTGRTAATYAAYADGNSDGTEVARAILPFDVVTDAAGNITLADAGGGGRHGETYVSIPVYIGGFFATDALVGLDANGIADLGKIVSGTATAGILHVR